MSPGADVTNHMFANVGPFAGSLIIRLNGLSTLKSSLVREALTLKAAGHF